MAGPTERELTAVRKGVERLDQKQLEALKRVLIALGYRSSDVCTMLGQAPGWFDRVLDDIEPFSGDDLARLCAVLQLKPGVIQRRLSFNKKQTPKQDRWVGPHKFLYEGHPQAGKVFTDVMIKIGKILPGLDDAHKKRIRDGKQPVTVDQLRWLIREAESAGILAKDYVFMTNIMNTIPTGVVTQTDWVASAEAKTEEKTKVTAANEVVWTEDNSRVTIANRTYSLSKGSDMQRVAKHIRALIEASALTIKLVMSEIEKGHRWLHSVEIGNQTFTKDELLSVASALEVEVEQLFTGDDLPEGVSVAAKIETAEIDPGYFRDLVLDPDVEVADGVKVREVLRLSLRERDGEPINWVTEWLKLTAAGAKFRSEVVEVIQSLQGKGPELKALAVKMILASNGGDDAE